MKTAGKFGIVAVVALGIYVLPGGGSALEVALTLLTILFFASIAVLVFRLYRQHGFELDSLEAQERLVLYASIGGAALTFTATNRLFDQGGAGIVVWLALLALCSYGIYWTWTRYRRAA